MLCLGMQFSQVKVLPTRTWPLACEDAGVCSRRLSIKLGQEGEDRDGEGGVEKNSHGQGGSKCRGLREVLVFTQRKQRFMEGATWDKDRGIGARVGPKRQDASNGGLCRGKGGIMGYLETSLNESIIEVGKEGGCSMFGVWEGIDMNAGISCGWLVGELCNCIRTGL